MNAYYVVVGRLLVAALRADGRRFSDIGPMILPKLSPPSDPDPVHLLFTARTVGGEPRHRIYVHQDGPTVTVGTAADLIELGMQAVVDDIDKHYDAAQEIGIKHFNPENN